MENLKQLGIGTSIYYPQPVPRMKYYKEKFYLLEINTQPGMTKLSLVPEISSYIGIDFINLIKLILEDASINK